MKKYVVFMLFLLPFLYAEVKDVAIKCIGNDCWVGYYSTGYGVDIKVKRGEEIKTINIPQIYIRKVVGIPHKPPEYPEDIKNEIYNEVEDYILKTNKVVFEAKKPENITIDATSLPQTISNLENQLTMPLEICIPKPYLFTQTYHIISDIGGSQTVKITPGSGEECITIANTKEVGECTFEVSGIDYPNDDKTLSFTWETYGTDKNRYIFIKKTNCHKIECNVGSVDNSSAPNSYINSAYTGVGHHWWVNQEAVKTLNQCKTECTKECSVNYKPITEKYTKEETILVPHTNETLVYVNSSVWEPSNATINVLIIKKEDNSVYLNKTYKGVGLLTKLFNAPTRIGTYDVYLNGMYYTTFKVESNLSKCLITIPNTYYSVENGGSLNINLTIECPPEIYGKYDLRIYMKLENNDTYETAKTLLPKWIHFDNYNTIKTLEITKPKINEKIIIENASYKYGTKMFLGPYNIIVDLVPKNYDKKYGDEKYFTLFIIIPGVSANPTIVMYDDNVKTKEDEIVYAIFGVNITKEIENVDFGIFNDNIKPINKLDEEEINKLDKIWKKINKIIKWVKA